MNQYVHGYSQREAERLCDQSGILQKLLHSGTTYGAGDSVLEAGCGVGAQSVILSQNSPQADFISIDMSANSLNVARERINAERRTNVQFQQADLMKLPFADESFGHVFVCFVLEHLKEPLRALIELRRVLKRGGSITVIEGDHGSCFWHPETEASIRVWDCLIKAQASMDHNALIGRQLYPLLNQAGFAVQNVSPAWVYADAGNPRLLDGMVNKIIVPMVETARDKSLEMEMIDKLTWAQGISDLERSGMPPEGTFFYTWFKGVALK